eukprot:1161378-Pelagomonas_calceolata.AAC.12
MLAHTKHAYTERAHGRMHARTYVGSCRPGDCLPDALHCAVAAPLPCPAPHPARPHLCPQYSPQPQTSTSLARLLRPRAHPVPATAAAVAAVEEVPSSQAGWALGAGWAQHPLKRLFACVAGGWQRQL